MICLCVAWPNKGSPVFGLEPPKCPSLLSILVFTFAKHFSIFLLLLHLIGKHPKKSTHPPQTTSRNTPPNLPVVSLSWTQTPPAQVAGVLHNVSVTRARSRTSPRVRKKKTPAFIHRRLHRTSGWGKCVFHRLADARSVISTADIISTVEFDSTGNYLATGDKGGRVVLFERNESVRGTIRSDHCIWLMTVFPSSIAISRFLLSNRS